MKILAIDTSGQQAGAAIMDEYITIGEIMINAQSGPKTWHHSEILMPAIERLFTLSGLALADMDYIAYTAGPGSFTGLRIGAATALGLARGINKPAIAVPTLDALAYNVLCTMPANNEESGEPSGLVIPLMDARRGQVYAAIYQLAPSGGLTRLTDYFAASIEETLVQVNNFNNKSLPTIYLGDGADANKTTILSHHPSAKFAPPNANRQRPASAALCAIHQQRLVGATGLDRPQSCRIADPIHSQNHGRPGAVAPTVQSPAILTQPVNLIYVRDPQAVRSAKKP